MAGYREDNFDLDAQEPMDEEARRFRWRSFLITAAYMVPLIGLWVLIDFPDGLGVHPINNGYVWFRVGEYYYCSYLLLERHHALDIVTFIYMWAPVIAGAVWLARNWQKPSPKYAEANLNSSSNSDAE